MKFLVLAAAGLSLLTATTALADQGARSSDRNEVNARLRDKADGKWSYKGQRWDRIKGPEWVGPKGWQRRSYGQGDFLPGLFMSEAYFVDPVALGLGLPAAEPGRHWVRVGPDLYLVAGRGKVMDVVPGVYY